MFIKKLFKGNDRRYCSQQISEKNKDLNNVKKTNKSTIKYMLDCAKQNKRLGVMRYKLKIWLFESLVFKIYNDKKINELLFYWLLINFLCLQAISGVVLLITSTTGNNFSWCYLLHVLGVCFLFGLLYLYIGYTLSSKAYNNSYRSWRCSILIFFSLLIFIFFLNCNLETNQTIIFNEFFKTVRSNDNFELGVGQHFYKNKIFLHSFLLFFLPIFIIFYYCFLSGSKKKQVFAANQSCTVRQCFGYLINEEKWIDILLILLFVFIVFTIYYLKLSAINFQDLLTWTKDKNNLRMWYILPFHPLLKNLETIEQKIKFFSLIFFLVFFYKDKQQRVYDYFNSWNVVFSSLWYRFIFLLFIFNFLLLVCVSGSLIAFSYGKQEYFEVYKFLVNAQVILLFVYIFWSPITIFKYLAPQSKAEINAANPYLIKKNKNLFFEYLDQLLNEKKIFLDETTIILWWIFLIFTVPGLELYFVYDEDFNEAIKIIFKSGGVSPL